jgi:hypothetical protein
MKRIVVLDVRTGGTPMFDDLREKSEARFGAGS